MSDTFPDPPEVDPPAAGPALTAPTPPAPRPFRLMRIREGKVLGGVAGGLGRAAGIDPSLARLAVFASCLTGVGLVAYVVLWLVLPQEAPWRGEVAVQASEPTDRYVRIGLGVGAALGVLDIVGNIGGAFAWTRGNWGYGPGRDFGGGGFPLFDFGGGLGLLLIGFGAALLITRRRGRGADGPPPTTPMGTGSSSLSDSGDGEPAWIEHTEAGPGTPRSLIAARVLGWFVVLWSLAIGAFGLFMWWVGAIRPGAPALSVPLGVLAFGGVVWVLVRSRRPGVILASLLVLLVPVAIAGDLRVNGDLGVRDLRVTDQTLEPSYRIAAGQLVLDLRDMEVLEGVRTVNVRMGTGQIVVKLPSRVTSVVTARVDYGGMAVLGREQGGSNQTVRVQTPGCPERGELVLNLRTRVGHIEVEGPGRAGSLDACAPVAA